MLYSLHVLHGVLILNILNHDCVHAYNTNMLILPLIIQLFINK